MFIQVTVGLMILGSVLLAVFAPKYFKMLLTIAYYQPIGIYRALVPPPPKSVKDDIILITGGAMGMGAIMGQRFGKLGAKIVLWDIQEKQLEETVQKLKDEGIQVWGFICDVSDRNKIYEAAAKVKSEVGEVSILINNAGIMCAKPLLETSDETIEKTMQINTLSHFWTIKSFLPGMLEKNRGHIVSISSAAGLFGVNKLAPYCTSKFAITGLHDSLCCELYSMRKLASTTDKNGIHLTSVHPYFVTTPLSQGATVGSTVKSFTPEEAVGCIVNGVLRNKRTLLLPPDLAVLQLLKCVLAGDTGLHMGETMKINTLSHFWTIKSFLPGMLEKNRGHIVSISSSAGLFGVNKLAPYCTSKFAVTGLHDSLCCELYSMRKLASTTDKNGIHLTSVHPYFVTTPLAQGATIGSTVKSYTPEEAVGCIVNGVLRNKRTLLLPPDLAVLQLMQCVLAGDTGLHVGETMKIHNVFDKFEGRGWK